jgi:hypothetical protein
MDMTFLERPLINLAIATKRIADTLEEQTVLAARLAGLPPCSKEETPYGPPHQTPAPECGSAEETLPDDPLVTKQPTDLTKGSELTTGSELSTEETLSPAVPFEDSKLKEAIDTTQTGPWDPLKEPVQSRYPSKVKQEAIAAAIKKFNITCPVAWTFPKRHQAILDHVADVMTHEDDILAILAPTPAPATAPGMPATAYASAPVAPMTWDTFKTAFLTAVDNIGKNSAEDIVQLITGQRNVNPEVCEGHYERIMQRVRIVESAQTPEVATPETVTTGSLTKDELLSLARILIIQGIQPPVIQAAIAHLAPGVTAMPDDKIGEAMECLQLLKV